MVFKRLYLNLVNIVTLLTLKSSLKDHPTRFKSLVYLQIKIVRFNPQRNSNIYVPTVCDLLKQSIYQPIHQRFGLVSISRLNGWQDKYSWRISQKISLTWNNHALFVSWPRQLKFSEAQPLIPQFFLLGSCFRCIFRFKCWKYPFNCLEFCGYIFCYFTPLWISIKNQTPPLDIQNLLSLHWGIRIRKCINPRWLKWSIVKILWIHEDISQHEHHISSYRWRYILTRW